MALTYCKVAERKLWIATVSSKLNQFDDLIGKFYNGTYGILSKEKIYQPTAIRLRRQFIGYHIKASLTVLCACRTGGSSWISWSARSGLLPAERWPARSEGRGGPTRRGRTARNRGSPRTRGGTRTARIRRTQGIPGG